MEHEAVASIIVYVPGMHPSLLPESLPPEVHCFDPGLAMPASAAGAQPERRFHTPENLPLAPRQARQWMRDVLAYGLQFERPGDLAATAAASLSEAHILPSAMRKDEAMALQSFASLGVVLEEAPVVEDTTRHKLMQAQMTLLLAWNLEERFLELADLNSELAASSHRFDQAIGPGGDDAADEGDSFAVSPVTADMQGPGDTDAATGLRVLEAMLAFLERDAMLITADPVLVQIWRETGIETDTAARLPDFLAGAKGGRVLCAPGWRFCGRSQPIADKPWLDAVIRIAVLDAA